MLSPTVVEEVQRLLKEGQLSWRKIAGRTAVSRGSVHAIAHGRRTTRLRRPSNAAHPRQTPGAELPIGLEGPIGRCRECGRRMVLPCRACHIERMKELGLIKRPTRRRA